MESAFFLEEFALFRFRCLPPLSTWRLTRPFGLCIFFFFVYGSSCRSRFRSWLRSAYFFSISAPESCFPGPSCLSLTHDHPPILSTSLYPCPPFSVSVSGLSSLYSSNQPHISFFPRCSTIRDIPFSLSLVCFFVVCVWLFVNLIKLFFFGYDHKPGAKKGRTAFVLKTRIFQSNQLLSNANYACEYKL